MSTILDTYGDKTLKTGIGTYWNNRYKIWEGKTLRVWCSTKKGIMKHWKRIKQTEPPVREVIKMPFIDWNNEVFE